MRYVVIAMIAIFGFAGTALASHCPKDAAKIEQALSSTSNAEAQALLEQGKSLHSSGNHAESVATLHKAMEMLGIPHE